MRRVRAVLLAVAALVAACAPQIRERVPPAPQLPSGFPAAYYEELAAQGKPVYRIDRGQSLVVIEVRRAGSLERLGHDHVVAARDLGGFAAPGEGRADLYVPLDLLTVDEPDLRVQARFDTQPSKSDVAGTRANMLERVLETEKYPFALVSARGGAGEATLEVTVTLHGVSRVTRVPAQLRVGDADLSANGSFSFNQSDFGIVPFSILGGTIAVRDRVDLRFSIRARRVR